MGLRLNIEKTVAQKFFEELGVDMRSNYLMDVKKILWKRWNLSSPNISIDSPKKTLIEQRPNQSFGIPITDEERDILLKRFNITNPSSRGAAAELHKKILMNVLEKNEIPNELSFDEFDFSPKKSNEIINSLDKKYSNSPEFEEKNS